MSNRLASQPSPYLRQHAHNPVDWYPWGDEAFAAARERDVPVLLSVGYSSCHWCHVMERESFDSKETAALMNRYFVNVKVDREERPDVDGIYMGAVQALTGHGGWPLTAFLTPDGLPFYGGTYFPPERRHGMPAFPEVLEAVHNAWQNRRDDVLKNATRLADALARGAVEPMAGPGEEPDREADPPVAHPEDGARGAGPDGDGSRGTAIELADGGEDPLAAACAGAWRQLAANFDPVHGGFGREPKFPQPVTLDFLLAWSAASGDPQPLEMAVHTLRAMALGGLRDHLAGGFHRYSVDRRWLVPHFEKMLYDNALLARVYLDGWRLTGDPFLASVCRETLRYLLDDLRHDRGGFFSARDADSEGEEGTFYVWTPSQVRSAAAAAGLAGKDVEHFMMAYDVTEEGNFQGRSILHLEETMEELALDFEVDPAALDRSLSAVRAALRSARSTREMPFRDEKIICAWNAFAVRALAEAGAALPEPDFVDAAARAGHFLFEVLQTRDAGDGRGPGLHRIWSGEGGARVPAYLEDWAALGNAALSLHEATLDPVWLERAVTLLEELLDRFTDPGTGLLHDAPEEADHLLYRTRDLADSATPSGNSLAIELLLRAGSLTGRTRWTARARELLDREAGSLVRAPGAFGRRLAQAVRVTTPPVEVAVTGDPGDPGTVRLLRTVHREYHPARVVTGGASPSDGHAAIPLLEGRGPVDGQPAAWVCRRYTCQAPVTTQEALRDALRSLD